MCQRIVALLSGALAVRLILAALRRTPRTATIPPTRARFNAERLRDNWRQN